MSRRNQENIEDRVSRIMASVPGASYSLAPSDADADTDARRLAQARDALMSEALEARRRSLHVGPLQAYTVR
jgi:hypothetical protein